MAWTETIRAHYRRDGLRYASDMTDAEWALLRRLLLPRRWVVERTFAWFGRCRRLSKDFEGSAATETAWLLVAHLRLLTRRLAAPKILSAL
jgi:transposase